MNAHPNRRRFAKGALATALLPALATSARAAFPDRPIKVIVPFGPGGLADTTIRVVGEKLGARLGQQIVVVNQPGAQGVIAAKAALSAPADGYTIAMLTNGTAVSAAVSKQLAFDPIGDFLPISSLGFFDFAFLVAKDSPVKTLQDFVAAAKAKPAETNIATVNIGSTQHLTATLFKRVTGINCAIVPFKTTPDVLTAVIRNDAQLAVDGFAPAKAMLADGTLRAIATTGDTRSAGLPDVPTAIEAGFKEFDVSSWNALFAPKGVPADIIAKLNAEIVAAVADPAVKAKLQTLGIEARAGTPAAIGDRLKADIAKWTDVVEKAGIARK